MGAGMPVRFQLQASAGPARAGILHTRRGEIATPLFMPVATQAAFRHLSMEDAAQSGAKVLLCNTYHLLDAPGPETLETLGGVHRFMKWDGGVLTDSGGFQIFSLEGDREITERGAHFRLPSGRRHMLTPESSIATQHAIGAEIMMALDICVESTLDEPPTRDAMERTHRWAARSLEARKPANGQALFGIVQGGCYRALREESARALTDMPFDGYAIGGLAVGETRAQREAMTELTAPMLPADKPRYLMGVGTPVDLVEAVHRGMDMFDCILPTKMAQQGYGYTFQGILELNRPSMALHTGPLEPGCPCATCTQQSVAYVHYLLRTDQPQGVRHVAVHNVSHYTRLMARLRDAIMNETWDDTRAQLLVCLTPRLRVPLQN